MGAYEGPGGSDQVRHFRPPLRILDESVIGEYRPGCMLSLNVIEYEERHILAHSQLIAPQQNERVKSNSTPPGSSGSRCF